MRFNKVDFPDPEAPVIDHHSPRSMRNVTLATAWIGSVPSIVRQTPSS
nr:hypothetical protein [Candidatus Microthrix sp.]